MCVCVCPEDRPGIFDAIYAVNDVLSRATVNAHVSTNVKCPSVTGRADGLMRTQFVPALLSKRHQTRAEGFSTHSMIGCHTIVVFDCPSRNDGIMSHKQNSEGA